jgi:ferredoxin
LNCQGGCEPSEKIKFAECILCLNCREACSRKDNVIRYQTVKSLAGEVTNPDISRRGFVLSLASGILAAPAFRLTGVLARNWYYKLIRPPGALAEPEFLKRCIKCGQCMRICPTNVIQPAGLEGGIETLWTPILNNRIGTSGCQLNCVACGQICPTSAIRPITMSEKLGTDEFASKGPIKLGTAFVDRNRCLPWAMNKPCIVCEENCPVSPKAIYTDETFHTIRDGILTVKKLDGNTIQIDKALLPLDKFATGDYYVFSGGKRMEIRANTESSITITETEDLKENIVPGSKIEIQVRLQRPYIDIEKCIGCGVCEHECPVSGKKAVRVSAEGETRSSDRKLYLET